MCLLYHFHLVFKQIRSFCNFVNFLTVRYFYSYKVCVVVLICGYVNQVLDHIHLLYKTMKIDICQHLCKTVSNHFFYLEIHLLNSLSCNLVTDVMILDINVFCLSIKDWVMCQCYGLWIVIFERHDDESQLILFLTRSNSIFLLDALHTSVFLEDLDQSMLMIELQKTKLYE